MKIQKTGPDSILILLDREELQDNEDLRQKAFEALAMEGIPAAELLELTAYTAGRETVVFIRADAGEYTYFGFQRADELLDAAHAVAQLFPEADAVLYRAGAGFYLATRNRRAGELLREFSWDIRSQELLFETLKELIPQGAIQILTGGVK